MRASTVIMIAVAAVVGLLAVFLSRAWLNSQADARLRSLEANRGAPASARTLVVATRPLRFGNELTPQTLREVAWPGEALPPGGFATINEMLSPGKRVVLTAIEANEPVLAMKITGPGQRATLSALVGDGMKAVTIRVNDVEGVGGFVLPGDHVDIILTRQSEKDSASTQVLLQDVRVLAIDQIADERMTNPSVPKSVTVEVDTIAAQKIGLAASIGTLSLVLRKAGETTSHKTARVTVRDLLAEIMAEAPRSNSTTVVVQRGMQKQDYRVPLENVEAPGYANARPK